ncbi:hypothetical protein GHT06_005779 [Daphnia sinensis]|uniref:Uncharacterized protein n=1 Tax=Daphnia sinensis TaxID=1820382 RepID=A0AAD5PKM2_9CRUS|nr:hypothetical protein GHT06_005779 [Daphnia sinensis]
MAKVEFNKDNCEQLPINDVSPSMFTMTSIDNEEAKPEVDGSSHEDAEEKEYSSGGSSLLRTNKEVEEVVVTAATVTIGGDTPAESNIHGKVVEALSGNKILSPSDTSSDIYVVRPDNSFVSDSNPNYLEIHFPDLLPFGRGGTGETRRVKISRKALLAYMLNLSTRQFQEVDFVLPLYDMVTRQQVSTIGFVRSKIPSRRRGADGTLSTKAEAFGQVSLEDMKKVCEHKINCAKTASKGGTLPPPPVSLHGVAAEFFNDITVATKHNQHSMAAAAENRGGVYAAHNSLGKAHIWFTFCPDDTKSFKILWYALGPEQSAIYKDQIPDGIIRFETLANRPVAGALNFERCLNIAIEYLVGWDCEANAPLKNRVNCEVSPPGKRASTDENITQGNTKISFIPLELNEFEAVVERLKKNIETFAVGELVLPSTEAETITNCLDVNCAGQLQLDSEKVLFKMRHRPVVPASEASALKCDSCNNKYSITETIDAALERGFQRCFGRSKLTEEETINLVWQQLRAKPPARDTLDLDCWLLHLSSIQLLVNMHDWKHREKWKESM